MKKIFTVFVVFCLFGILNAQQVVPLNYNGRIGELFQNIDYAKSQTKPEQAAFAENSVLASGNWYKIKVKESGIYKITYEQLNAWGIDAAGINPQKIRVFGNSFGILPESNTYYRPIDLLENAIYVNDGGDGEFNPGDFFLFYGKSPDSWRINPFYKVYEHIKHLYADYNCYFLNFNTEEGKRIVESSVYPFVPNSYATTFTDYRVYEKDSINLIKSGKDWYGEKFDNLQTKIELPSYYFQDVVVGKPAGVRLKIAAKSADSTSFDIIKDDVSILHCDVPDLDPALSSVYARSAMQLKTFTITQPELNLSLQYNPGTVSSQGWLDFIELNIERQLKFRSGQLLFRNAYATGYQKITRFGMQFSTQVPTIWDLSRPTSIKEIIPQVVGDSLFFTLPTDTLCEFVAFDASQFFTPELIGLINNQNLHSVKNIDLLIITQEVFYNQAVRLGELHKNNDGLTYAVTILPEIYNEFSSGIQDIAAIRDFVRNVYFTSDSLSRPRYLLLFGDGSFDPKNRYPDNNNFVPTFQSEESLVSTGSYVCDDFYGLLDKEEGEGAVGNVDIGIGRLAVSTVAEADAIVNKIEHYMIPSPLTLRDWRNITCFIADDENKNLHFDQAEELSEIVKDKDPVYNIDKIYLDSYKQITNATSSSYPDATKALAKRIEQGALIINYTGHGSELGLSGEGLATTQDIEEWENIDCLPLFITATCEFSRFDDPERVSAGEWVMLNSNGGGIALFTTTRPAFSTPNFNLNKRFYNYVFARDEQGNYLRLGDIVKKSKVPSSIYFKNFVLLGDPALRLAYPKLHVLATKINDIQIEKFADTLQAFDRFSLSGIITNASGEKVDDFNGKVFVKIFDKSTEYHTLGNDWDSYKTGFFLQKNVIFDGSASVVNGDFTINVLIPRDIMLSNGFGKFSFYAENGSVDATGYFDKIVIGGINPDPLPDTEGPAISMYLNDTSFRSEDVVHNNAMLMAALHDTSGINVLNSGIGHNIILTTDHNNYSSFIVNDYFTPLVDNYTDGIIKLQLETLPEGKHTLTLRAWDLYNNSSEAEIEFNVQNTIQLKTHNVLCYPNPFSDKTWFEFSHNQFNGGLSMLIEICTMTGNKIKTIGPVQITSEGYVSQLVEWDGRSDNGSPISNGMYIYKVKILESKNNYIETSGKVIVSKQ
ncbi:MAG: type IX secretion system sortase PorU [Lentimicrobiaceae bacterium]|nr:type IX secretion system sortase PorU [Lentimicrobiaceae bacterium]